MTLSSQREIMSPRLLKVAERAKRDPKGPILALASLIDEPALKRAFEHIRSDAAKGVDEQVSAFHAWTIASPVMDIGPVPLEPCV